MKHTGILFHALFLLVLGSSMAEEGPLATQSNTVPQQAQVASEGTVKVVRNQVAAFSEDQAERFLQRVALRQVAAERGEMLRQILSEKVALHNQILEELKLSYDWHRESRYRFDEKASVLFKLPVEAKGEKAEVHNESEEEVVHTFDNEDDLERFRRLLTAKQQLEGQTASLTSLLNEQLQTLSRVRDNLKNTFNVDPDKQYHYDHKEKTLYLLSDAGEE